MKVSQYLYQVVDSKSAAIADVITETREDAREVKRKLEDRGFTGLKILQYQVKQVVR